MKPNRLIVLNGNPGMGKTTLAERYVNDHPLTLNLDIDKIWHMMGQWQSMLHDSQRLKLRHAYVLADAHLREGYDVIVPDLLETLEQYENFERLACVNNALFREVVLLSNRDNAIERCKARARRLGYADGFRPGGVLDTHGRELKLAEMYDNVLNTIALRENTVRIAPVEGDIDGTYAQLLKAVR